VQNVDLQARIFQWINENIADLLVLLHEPGSTSADRMNSKEQSPDIDNQIKGNLMQQFM
jgi:hypothetical protein